MGHCAGSAQEPGDLTHEPGARDAPTGEPSAGLPPANPKAGLPRANPKRGKPDDRFQDEMLARALAEESLTEELVDGLLARMLVAPAPVRKARLDFTPLVPATHGVLALTTFMLATLAAIAAL